MNIQIFGKIKCPETKKAERYFRERNIRFQFIDIVKYGFSKGEYESVKNAVGGMAALIDVKSKEYTDQYMDHLASQEDAEERLFANPGMFRTPVVRNGKMATVGYKPDIWRGWS